MNDRFNITGFTNAPAAGCRSASLTWNSAPNRLYYLQSSPDLSAGNWTDSGLGLITPDGAATTRAFSPTNGSGSFFRVSSVRPLSP